MKHAAIFFFVIALMISATEATLPQELQTPKANRHVRMIDRQAVVFPNISINPNPRVQQFEISIATHPSNPNIVMAVWNSIDTALSRNRIGWSYTNNAGFTWTGGDTLPTHLDAGTQPMVDPGAAIDYDGYVFVSGFYRAPPNGEVFVARSSDIGVTWAQTTMANGDYADKPHTVVDVNAGSPYRNTLYTAYTPFGIGSPSPIRFLRSTNRGQDFSAPIAISGTVTGSAYAFGANLAVSPDSVLYATWGGFSSNIWNSQTVILGFNRSSDGGITWRGATQIGTYTNIGTLVKGVNAVRAPSLPSMAVDRSVAGPRRGWIYIVYPAMNPTIPDIFLIRSTDGGASWSNPVVVNQDGSGRDQWQCWISVDPVTGTLFVVYYDSRNFPANDSAQVYISASTDGGVTFGDILVSDVPFLPAPTRHLTLANYMGSYIGIAALDSMVWPCWNDNRTGFHQAYTARVVFRSTSVREVLGRFPTAFALEQNYPNPFNPTTVVRYSIPAGRNGIPTYNVTLKVFTILGQEVATLVNEQMKPGIYEVTWDAAGTGSGVYFYRLEAGSFTETRKLILLR